MRLRLPTVLFVSVLASWVLTSPSGDRLLAQTEASKDLPADHPKVNKPDRRQQASQLTESVACGEPSGNPADVPRKNFIDEHIFGKMERNGIPHSPLAGDAEFLRRVSLDLTGRIPYPVEVREFVASSDPAKRDKLIDHLIGSKAYLERWTYW